MPSPVQPYRNIVEDSGTSSYINRILIATPVTGSVRIEWVQARYGQIIPVNWSQVQYIEWMNGYYPLRYQVADAQNMCVKIAITKEFEWMLLWEHDVIPPIDALVKLNNYMREEQVPVVSGLYHTRSRPSEPLIFKGRGTGSFVDFVEGDKIWCDGIPTGFLLIHCGILRKMWDESEEYVVHYPGGRVAMTRRVFETPRELFINPETGDNFTLEGTSDLEWCTRVMKGEYFAKAGWEEYQKMEYPFLVDTSIKCSHINMDGEQFP
jgi:hypothetical protein